MAKATKRFTLVGNWKMNPDTLEEAKALFSSISRKAAKARKVSIVVAPPAPFLQALSKKDGPVALAAQDVSEEPRGAFTGSVSAREVKSSGAEYAIIGHSERRAAGDSDEIVAAKVREALDAGLRVILCVGESERDQHAQYLRLVRDQVLAVISTVDKKQAQWITIAYEPVWAIGKSYSLAPEPSDIHEMSLYIKKAAAEALGKKDGLKLQVLYGGSVNFENAQAIIKDGSIDGLLVGRQSLDPEAFGNMIEYADSI
jgi:triosephosphate isomerase (TIM)